MKKFLITLFTILYCATSALAEVVIEHKNKDTFTPKEYTLTLEELLNQQEEDVEEADEELAIDWNQWHANVRNAVDKEVSSQINKFFSLSGYNFWCEYYFYVDKYKQISDIVVLYIYKTAVNVPKNAVNKEKCAYVYYYSTNKFYKLRALSDTIYFGKDRNNAKYLLDKIKSFKVTTVSKDYVPEPEAMKAAAKAIKTFSSSAVLAYPQGTKRTKVKVHYATVPLSWKWNAVSSFKAGHFNDIEKTKKNKN